MTTLPPPLAPAAAGRAAWMRAARWGLMFHYLDLPASSNVASATPPEAWNRRVDGFDAARFAAQVRESGAGYVIFTLGQNTGHYCAPNPVYDELVGRRPSRLSRRDLVAEIAAALAPEVRTIAYLPSVPPANDEEAVRALGLTPAWDALSWGLRKTWPDAEDDAGRLAAAQRRWERIAAWWGERWGDAVAGWWIDGCYFADRMYRHEDAPNFASFARALRAGNPGRALAFNPGTAKPFEAMTPEQDYTAGEMASALRVHDVWNAVGAEGAPSALQTHVLTFLGEYWGRGNPRFPDALAAGYAQYVAGRGGALTWDVPVTDAGEIPAPFRRQLAAVAEAAR